ncbi:glycerol uptake facilitator protein [Mucilaginibacter rubeus]|uniref:Aquaporin family protein n=1 Tax=Mucilaginibacter rubeus TaxID=2027860 RepID=A0AAE6MIQ8_9SPHI|nr:MULTISPECIES: MIP/aquaporin family protein [Mucilaginibacter]QEM04474.1 aquaporin family protein [Mucilaginibacter rubeus]QEM17069.1 aquaporin family protein [Mucilaginibacter gossypii]QTE46432.1 aquaporin family protein [Mucilaginibacter rubeus]QTE53029.1 aquaporin family protein [Mucilaginibacter rubeus]QTE58116.1 aquaporin family protein [Mucilaginibacter rubeus]
MSPFVAELIGTMLLILLGDGVVANVVLKDTKGNNSGWIVITTAWGLAVFVGVVVAGPYSGAHLNPAVTIALAIAGKFAWANVVPYIIAQFAGACIGAFLVWVMYYDHFKRTNDPASILAVFCTGPAVRNYISNIASEVIGAFVLLFTIFYIAGAEITPAKTPIGLGSVGAIPVALLVWVIGLSLGGTTGYAINPARDLGPRFMHMLLPIKGKGTSDWAYAWIPIIGPLVGASIAAVLYLSIKL